MEIINNCLFHDETSTDDRRPKILVHYMPWFSARPTSAEWGWHWTMNAFDPEKIEAGRRAVASHYYPLIGPYDSGDTAVVEYHLLLMKLAGIDGLMVDWCGIADLYDYPIIHRNTASLFPAAARIGLKIGICYEDQTIPRLVEAGKITADGQVTHVKETLDWLRTNWFADRSYLTYDDRPVLISFGYAGLSDQGWAEALPTGNDALIYLSEQKRRPVAAGAFDWPVPSEWPASLDRFEQDSRDWPVAMPAAFPRFHDIYDEAKVHTSFGILPDDQGRTFVSTLTRALATRTPFVQIATWNDWGEGTSIEPSSEFGFRDLEAVQQLRRAHIDPAFAPRESDLQAVHKLYKLRLNEAAHPGLKAQLDEASNQLASGQLAKARETLDRLEADA